MGKRARIKHKKRTEIESTSTQNPSSISETSQTTPTVMSDIPKTDIFESCQAKNLITASSETTLQENPSDSHVSETSATKPMYLPSFSFRHLSDFDIVRPSKKKPPVIFGSWEGIARLMEEEVQYSFYLEMKPASKLNIALAALTDSKMNGRGIGRIDVDVNAMEITVHKKPLFCFLRLNATGMIKFQCHKPLENKMVVLTEVFEKLFDAADNDIVSIYHVLGSNELSFKFGTESPDAETFAVKLYQSLPGYEKCPVIEFACEIVISSEHLRQMLPLMVKDNKAQEVFLQISHDSAIIIIGEKAWPYTYDEKQRTRGLEPGKFVTSTIRFPYPDSLRKASYLEAVLLICPVVPPCDKTVLRFNLGELGDLAYVILEDDSKQKVAPISYSGSPESFYDKSMVQKLAKNLNLNLQL